MSSIFVIFISYLSLSLLTEHALVQCAEAIYNARYRCEILVFRARSISSRGINHQEHAACTNVLRFVNGLYNFMCTSL